MTTPRTRSIKLYNTLSRTLETLNPVTPPTVKLYCCGPTVYHYQHLGNLRTYLFEDLLARTIRNAGYKLLHVMNITDVGHLVSDADSGEDKMAVAARREGRKSHELAEFYTNAFFADCAKLSICRPDVVCNATAHIKEMIELIERLEKLGATYSSGGNIYFDISKFPEYGKLARLDLSKLEAGARIEIDSQKRNPLDFVLWFTKSKFDGQELQWDSPWGRGYPGWHIECSAMAMKYCGEEFDIHCGGIDHIPVHHTNEIAQSEAATGKQFSRIWMHGGFLVNEKNEKMAKSSGVFLCVKELVERGYDPLAYRLLCFGTHYRNQLSFSWEAIASAAQALERLRRGVESLQVDKALEELKAPEFSLSSKAEGLKAKFEACLYDDLNAPQALAVLWESLGERDLPSVDKLALLKYFDQYFALGLLETRVSEELPPEILALAEERATARKQKNWARSDELRDELQRRGFVVEDKSGETKVRRAPS